MRVFVARVTGAIGRYLVEETVPGADREGLVLRYGFFYDYHASDSTLGLVNKRQMPVIRGGTGIWSFAEVTDGAAAAVTAGSPSLSNISVWHGEAQPS